MKTFEIEVVRTYTTTIEVEVPDNLSPSYVEEITLGNTLCLRDEDLYHEIWDIIAEKELEQMDTGLESVKVKELYHEEFKSFNDAPYGQEDE